MGKKRLVELLSTAKLEFAYDMDNNKVIDITLERNELGVQALCMDKLGEIAFYTENRPMYPNWYVYNIKDLATKNELPMLYKALKEIQKE